MVTAILCERAGLPSGVFASKDFIGESYAIIRGRSVTDQPLIVLEDPKNREWGQITKDDLRELVRLNFDQVIKALAPKKPEDMKSVSVLEWARAYKLLS